MRSRSRSPRPRRSRGLAVPCLLVGLWLLAGDVSGQQRTTAAGFTDAVDVRVVNVEVVVTDRRGRRVQGLEAEDFQLFVDGEPEPIGFFTEVAGGRAKPAASGGLRGVSGLSPEALVGVNFLIFIDDTFSIERDRNRVLDGLASDLSRHVGTADRVAVVAFDGASMETLTPWTNSLHDLDDALERARGRPAHGLHRKVERLANEADREARKAGAAIGRAAGEPGPFPTRTETAPQRARRLKHEREYVQASVEEKSAALGALMSPLERTYAAGLASRLERSAMAAAAALRSHAGQPGRKAMLLLSGGAAENPRSAEDEPWRQLTDAANLMGYTLYPVDVPGFDPGFRGAPDPARRGPASSTSTRPVWRSGGRSTATCWLSWIG